MPSSQGYAFPANYTHFSRQSFENTNALTGLERKTFHGLYTAHHGLFRSVMAPQLQVAQAPAPRLAGVVWLVMLTVALELPPIPIRTNTQLGNRQFICPPGKSLMVLLLAV